MHSAGWIWKCLSRSFNVRNCSLHLAHMYVRLIFSPSVDICDVDDVEGSSSKRSISILIEPVVLISIRFISFFTRTAAEVEGSVFMLLSTFKSCSCDVVATFQVTSDDDDANTEVSDLLVCVDVGAVLLFLLRLRCG